MGRRLSALLALALLPSPALAAPVIRCGVTVEVEGYPGLLWRTVDERGIPEPYYSLQINNDRDGTWPFLNWGILVPGQIRPRNNGTSSALLRPEKTAFAAGPDRVPMVHPWLDRNAFGPVRAFHYGDGQLVGTQRLPARSEAVRARRRGFDPGLGWLLDDRRIIARLAQAREWLVVVRDNRGREVGRRTIHLPPPALVEAAYRAARPRVDAMVADYRRVCSPAP